MRSIDKDKFEESLKNQLEKLLLESNEDYSSDQFEDD